MRRRLFPAVVLLSLLPLACFGGGSDDPEPTPTPEPTATPAEDQGPVIALQDYVSSTLQKGFVADCAKAEVATDAGKICAAFQGEREQQRAYIIGLTFSEFTDWVILEAQGGGWQVVATRPITAETIEVPGIPWPLRTGVDVVVAGTGNCLNVREGASLNALAVDCIADGTVIQLAAGPQEADDIEWWQVDGRAGWVAGDYLRYPDAATAPPIGQAPTPTPTPEPTRGPVLP